jgi:S1-C subfamily serine protease
MIQRIPVIAALLLAVGCAGASASRSVTLQSPTDGPPSVEETFAAVAPSVVTIHTATSALQLDEGGMLIEGAYAIGSGVLVSDDGRILTAAHVIQTAEQIVVEFPDGELRPAHVVGSVKGADAALIQLDEPAPESARVAEVGDSDLVRVGSRCMVVGAPRGISHSLTVGHISARRFQPGRVQQMVRPEFFQTDASINQGNSGGPMFDMNGRVIGIVSYIVTASGGSEGLGFAVTSNVCRKLLLEASPFWSGTDEILVAGAFAKALNVPGGRSGLLIQQVAEGSPGALLGLEGGTVPAQLAGTPVLLGGDIIIEIAGIAFDEKDAGERILEALSSLDRGSELRLRVLRGGRRMVLKGELGDLLDRAEEARRKSGSDLLLEMLREQQDLTRAAAERTILTPASLTGGTP